MRRFCWQADIALEQGVEYAVVMDADIMLISDFVSEFRELMQAAPLVTMWEWSSQARGRECMWRSGW